QSVEAAAAHMRNLVLQNIAYSPDFTSIFQPLNQKASCRIAAAVGEGGEFDSDRSEAREIISDILDAFARRDQQAERMRIGEEGVAIGEEDRQRHMGVARLGRIGALDPILERISDECAVFP